MAVSQVEDTSRVFSVGELTRRIRVMLETGFPPLWVRGELSGVTFHRSGHLYLTLKDSAAQIPVVMWRDRVRMLQVRPRDGEEVLVYGHLTVYDRGGRYQLAAEVIQPAGRGALAEEFEKLKARLAAEGLFDPERKRPVPPFPGLVGVVTSPGGAAVRDILVTLKRRAFDLKVLFTGVKVQGEGAADEIAAAIHRLAKHSPRPDVIIVGRGGGSIEDLWAFNEERVVRAIAECPVPVIAGVGHETDITLTDLVADLRAATPTAAAEHAVPDRRELSQRIEHLGTRMSRALSGRIESLRMRLSRAEGSYGLRRLPDRLLQHAQRLDDLDMALRREMKGIIESGFDRATELERRLDSLSPLRVLQRGYAVARRDGHVISDVALLAPGDDLDILFASGEAETKVVSVREKELDPPGGRDVE